MWMTDVLDKTVWELTVLHNLHGQMDIQYQRQKLIEVGKTWPNVTMSQLLCSSRLYYRTFKLTFRLNIYQKQVNLKLCGFTCGAKGFFQKARRVPLSDSLNILSQQHDEHRCTKHPITTNEKKQRIFILIVMQNTEKTVLSSQIGVHYTTFCYSPKAFYNVRRLFRNYYNYFVVNFHLAKSPTKSVEKNPKHPRQPWMSLKWQRYFIS